jgi:uncharacterized lipoprotein
MQTARLTICFLLIVTLSGCSMMTKEGRQQHAYEKYVRNSSKMRYKRALKFHMAKTDIPLRQAPSEPKVNTTVSASPEAVPTSDAPSEQ